MNYIGIRIIVVQRKITCIINFREIFHSYRNDRCAAENAIKAFVVLETTGSFLGFSSLEATCSILPPLVLFTRLVKASKHRHLPTSVSLHFRSNSYILQK